MPNIGDLLTICPDGVVGIVTSVEWEDEVDDYQIWCYWNNGSRGFVYWEQYKLIKNNVLT